MSRHPLLLILTVVLLAAPAVACGRSSASPVTAPADAEAQLRAIVLDAGDIGDGFVRDVATTQTNEAAARARPDTDNARRQYSQWGQVLAFNIQFSPPNDADLVYTGRTARVMNEATLFETPEGAAAALAFTHDLSPSVIANVLVNDGGGARISNTQVVKDRMFPSKGDESFAWRLSGKATFESGSVTAFIADAVFVREGRIVGNVIAVAFGQQPDQSRLEALVDRFVARIQAAER